MRAAVLRGGRFLIDELPDPRAGEGQVLVAVRACGICGSDLAFARRGADITALRATMQRAGDRPDVDFAQDVFMGHEFAAEIVEAGPGTDAPPPGTLVTALPLLRLDGGVASMVCSNSVLGGFGELMLLGTEFLHRVPAGLGAEQAALTEPMTVGYHAVNRSGVERERTALVVGAGPVGLSVIAALAQRGVSAIVASDLSPVRRSLATVMGAHESVDPSARTPFDAWDEIDGVRPPTVFVAVAVAGLLDELMRQAPRRTRFVVIGATSAPESFAGHYALTKELSLQYAFGYSAPEFSDVLRALGDGLIDVRPMITDRYVLEDINTAFEELSQPDAQCKTLVVP